MDLTNVKKLEYLFQEGLSKGDEHFIGISLNSQDDNSGFITTQSWYKAVNYALIYKDAQGTDIKSIYNMNNCTNKLSDDCIEIYIKNDADLGSLLIVHNQKVLNYNNGDNDFTLLLSMTFATDSKDGLQANTLVLTFDSKNPNCIVSPIITKRKAVITIDFLINQILKKE